LSMLLQDCDLPLHRWLLLTEKAIRSRILRIGEVHTGSWTCTITCKEIGGMSCSSFQACFREISALSNSRDILGACLNFLDILRLIGFNELIKTLILVVASFHSVILINVEYTSCLIQVSCLLIDWTSDFLNLRLKIELSSWCSKILRSDKPFISSLPASFRGSTAPDGL
jgi:hypothetical protein